MATLSTLTDRMMSRLGITTLSPAGQAQVEECINAAVTRLSNKGLPGLGDLSYTGEIAGSSTLTVSAHTAASSAVTMVAVPATPVYPGDVVKFSDGVYREIFSIAGTVYDFGSPILTAQTGSLTLYQRCIKQPYPGRVSGLYDQSTEVVSESDENALLQFGLVPRDSARSFAQRYDGTTAYIVMWPVPTSATTFAVKQQRSWAQLLTTTDLPWPDTTLDSVLGKAISIWRGYRTGGVSPVEVDASKREVSDSHEGTQVGTSDGITRRRPQR